MDNHGVAPVRISPAAEFGDEWVTAYGSEV